MTFQITIPDSLAVPANEMYHFGVFLQRIANRRAQGFARYGVNRREKRYLSRMMAETAAYRRTGNIENLYNAAVYAYLESYAPENAKAYFDSTAKSVTRKKFGGGEKA